MTPLACLASEILYRNPAPHVVSRHAYFPSLVRAANGDLLCSLVLGEAFEAVNLRVHLCRSRDDGATWTCEGPLDPAGPGALTSEAARLTALPDGTLLALLVRHDRAMHPEAGLTNPATLGFVPTSLWTARSTDAGRSWTAPNRLQPPLEGPAFELCCPIVPLRDGRLLLPTQTWPGWDGACPNGIRMGAFVSADGGRSWPHWMDVLREPQGRVFFWESKIAELPDGRLLAVAWVYDDDAKRDRPNAYALSADGGASWSPPRSTGLLGQTLAPLALDDVRVLSLYRRMDQPGLWATRSRLDGDRWINEAELPLWGARQPGLTQTTADMARNFNVLRFGAPSLLRRRDGTILAAFWGYEDTVSVIRRLILRAA